MIPTEVEEDIVAFSKLSRTIPTEWEEIRGVLAEDKNGQLYWLPILDIYRTPEGLVIKVDEPNTPR